MKEIGIFLGVCLADSVTILPTLISVAVGGSLIVMANNTKENMNKKIHKKSLAKKGVNIKNANDEE